MSRTPWRSWRSHRGLDGRSEARPHTTMMSLPIQVIHRASEPDR
jgi:hypothetical protein